MKRIKILAALLLCIPLTCAACSGNQFEMEPDTAANTILESVSFDDTLVSVPENQLASHYPKLSSVSDAYSVYISATGATTEEIAVAHAKGGSKADDVKAQFEKRIEEQRFRYESYLPGQVPKLDSAVIRTKGNYVVMVICEDADQAAGVVKDLLG